MIQFLIILFVIPLLYYLLFLIFDFLGFKKIALFHLAVFDAPFFGFNSKKISKYCLDNCKDKRCPNCIYWTCDYYMKNLDKDDKI